MLGARNIAAHFVVENLEQIGQAMRGVLSSAENDLVGDYILAAGQACVEPAPQAAVEVAGEPQTEMALAGKVTYRPPFAVSGGRRQTLLSTRSSGSRT